MRETTANCNRWLEQRRESVALCTLAAPVAWIESAAVGVSTAFAAGIALLFGVVSVPIALIAMDTVGRELAPAE